MVREFTINKQTGAANATIATLVLSLFLQMLLVFAINMKQRKRVITRELLFVALCIKPGVDAYRVVTKQKQRPNTMMHPKMESKFIRGVELIFECIPSVIIQLNAFVNQNQSALAAISVLSGVCTAAFISASISIETEIYGIIGSLIALQVISFSSFLYIIEPKYRATFTSLRTGPMHCQFLFHNNTLDSEKIKVFEDNRDFWLPIKDEVKIWLNERLPTWLEEKPEWFNSTVKSMIEDKFVNDPELLKAMRKDEEETDIEEPL
ncbi:hypothetical protein TrST_g11333 [Triparma strigata]|uniref:Uncharacterized protein n=1 Tax=Triparma strigata TaxID=1606541 RepID=A0A9W7EA52_9STRA|nr:hypothetical protein TrST_g11333 [Triparma strigata]